VRLVNVSMFRLRISDCELRIEKRLRKPDFNPQSPVRN
jgi:hypothetical protein